jgi:diguanylate cyclase (GGDEF)-like protein
MNTHDTLAESSLEILSASPLFKGMNDLELNAITAFMDRRLVMKDAVVFNEGDIGEEIFILVSGALSAYAHRGDGACDDVARDEGARYQLFTLDEGFFFGEMAAISRDRRSTTIIATEDSDLLVLHGVDFYRILYEYPAIGVRLLKAMGQVQAGWLAHNARHLNDLLRWGESARRRAITDDLTGLNNRRFLEESIAERFRQGAVGLRELSLVMMDLDRVHEINERYGSLAGDTVICAAADVIRSCVRSGDISARLSGDEFAILLPDTGVDQARSLAERIRAGISAVRIEVPVPSVGEPFGEFPGTPGSGTPSATPGGETVSIRIGASIGIAAAPAHADSVETLGVAADNALRKAKELGRNRVEAAG